MIRKVQLPMAKESLVLATNQGLLYVLSMVVIGGMVGGGSLGYIVVSGFSQDQLFGKGLAAGIAIAALGVMLDRIARYAAAGRATARLTHTDTTTSPRTVAEWKRRKQHHGTRISPHAAGRSRGGRRPRPDRLRGRRHQRRPTPRAAATAATSGSRSTRGPATSPTPT